MSAKKFPMEVEKECRFCGKKAMVVAEDRYKVRNMHLCDDFCRESYWQRVREEQLKRGKVKKPRKDESKKDPIAKKSLADAHSFRLEVAAKMAREKKIREETARKNNEYYSQLRKQWGCHEQVNL